MAKCDFDGGISNVRGTLAKQVYYDHGKKITRSIVASVRNGKQRIHIREYGERRTALTPNEARCRVLFGKALAVVNALSEERKQQFAKEGKRDKYKFNGKQYKSFRGYIIARVYADLASKE